MQNILRVYKSGEKELYELRTFKRSNHDMIVHQKPLVSTGAKFKK
jgi:DNA-directed RNA polymerase beta subunit